MNHDASARGIVIAKPGSTCTQAGPNSIIYVFDDGSRSTNGPIVQWEWNFGDGWEDCTETQGLCSTTMSTPGTYVFHLRVTDSTGKKGQAKIKCTCTQGFDAEHVFMVWGADEGDEMVGGDDGTAPLRYHTWRWRTLSYDPDMPSLLDAPELEIAGDFDRDGRPDVVVCRSNGSADDFCGIDIDSDGIGDDCDDDGTDDDPSLRRSFSFPHVLETSGRCIGKSKPDVYVWKISSSNRKHTKSGHVTLLK